MPKSMGAFGKLPKEIDRILPMWSMFAVDAEKLARQEWRLFGSDDQPGLASAWPGTEADAIG
jgi:hypothetical protein